MIRSPSAFLNPSAAILPGPPALHLALVALGYWLTGQLSFLGSSGLGFDRLIWLPSGLALAALLVGGLRLWPALAIGGVALGLTHDMDLGSSLVLGAAGTLEGLVGAAVLQRLGFDTRFVRLRETLMFCVIAFGSALLGGTLEFVAMLQGIGQADRPTAWWVFWLGRALGTLLVAPLALGLLGPARRLPGGLRQIELIAMIVATGGLSLAVFAAMGDPTMFNQMSYALFPLLLWGVLRFGPPEVSALLLLTALVAAWGTASGNGPFALAGRETSLGSLYLYLSVASVGALALAASIAERTGVAEALSRSERQYRELVETMNEGVIALDAAGRVRFANGSFSRMAGTTPEALVGRPVVSLLGEGGRAWPLSPDPALDAQANFEAQLQGAPGGALTVSVSPRAIRDDANRVTGWLAVVADVSEQRRTDDMLRWIARATAPLTGEAFFRELVRHLASAFRFRHAFITECVNTPPTQLRTLARWNGTGFVPNETYALAGTPCEDVIAKRKTNCVRDGVEARFATYRGMGVAGYLGVPIMDATDERAIGHAAFLSEGPMDEAVLVSPLFQILLSRAGAELRRRRAEEQGRQHLQQLAQVSRALALGEMGSAIAHELNQPLASVATYAQASRRMLEAGGNNDEVRHAMERIAVQAERAGDILRRLRGFLASGATSAASVDLGDLVVEIMDLAEPEARQRGVTLKVELATALAKVHVDGIQVQQVVFNLLRNAIDAAAGSAARDVYVLTREADGGVEVAVTDTGAGVPAALSDRVFEPFFTTKSEGTGIGLAISRSITEAHGGRLRIERPAEGGARFVLWLPRAEDRNA